MTEPPKFKFLAGNCADRDLTEGKTHQRIADQLYDLIVSGPSDGMTIGLEGDWGSGKSTVIELLRQKLEPNNESKVLTWLHKFFPICKKSGIIFFFYVDAWEHEGDPLRRVFLEALIDKLEKSDGLFWRKNKLEKIRKRVAVKKTATKLTGLGLTLAVAGLLMPLVAKQIPPIPFKETIRSVWEFCQGLNILVVVLCVLVVLIVCQVLKAVFAKLGKPAVFSTERTTGLSLESERTSIEFSMCFDEILEVINPVFDKIVMIIDNLDRIDPKDALRGWSTLQTFVQRKNPLGEPKKGIAKWIIVPYAEEGLRRIWNDGTEEWQPPAQDETGRAMRNDQAETERRGGKRGGERVASFMDKSFDLRLHVPKMVVSDWRTFASDCIQKAMPDLLQAETQTILDILLWSLSRVEDAPSFRQIKHYINHVVVLRHLHGQHVSLDTICFYAARKHVQGLSDSDIERELLDDTWNPLPLGFGTSDIFEGTAAILYGVPQAKAIQLLLRPTIEKWLKLPYIEQLQSMRHRCGSVVDELIQYIVFHADLQDHPRILASIQMAFPDSSCNPHDFAFRFMRGQRLNIKTSIGKQKHDVALALIELASSESKLAKEMADAYATSLPALFAAGEKNSKRKSNAREIATSADLCRMLDEVSAAAKQTAEIPYKSFYKNFPFSKFSPEEMKQLASHSSGLDDAEEHLASLIHPNEALPEWIANWFAALTANGMTKVDKILDSLAEVFKMQYRALMPGDAGSAFWRMMVALESIPRNLRPVARIKAQLLEVCDQIPMPQGFHSKLCFLLAKYLESESDNPQAWERQLGPKSYHYQQFWGGNDDSIGRDIHGCIALSGEYEWLAAQARVPEKRLVGNIVKAALAAQDSNLFKVSQPFQFLKAIWPMVPADMHVALVKCFADDEARLRNLGEPKGGTLTADPELCRELLDHCSVPTACPSPTYQTLVKKCTEELHKFTKDQWEQALDEGKVCQLLAFLAEKGVEIKLENPFCATFESLVLETLESPYGSNWDFDVLVTLYRAMAPTFQRPFASKVGSQLLNYKLEIDDDDLRKFLFDFPDYSDWVADARAEILEAITDLTERSNLEALSDFTGLLKRHRKAIVYWEDLNQILNPYLAKVPDEADEQSKVLIQKIKDDLQVGSEK